MTLRNRRRSWACNSVAWPSRISSTSSCCSAEAVGGSPVTTSTMARARSRQIWPSAKASPVSAIREPRASASFTVAVASAGDMVNAPIR